MVVRVNHFIARSARRVARVKFGDLLVLSAYFQVDFIGAGSNGFSYRPWRHQELYREFHCQKQVCTPLLLWSGAILPSERFCRVRGPAQRIRPAMLNLSANSETQKVRVSEFPRQSFRVGQFRAVLALAQKVQNTTFTVVGRIWGVFVPDLFGTKSGNSETPPQKLRNTNSEIGFPGFRVGLSEFPSQTFRVSEVEVFPCREGPCRFQYIGATQPMLIKEEIPLFESMGWSRASARF